MRVAVFIVYLFSFLLKGNHYVLEPKVEHKFAYSQTVDKNQRSKHLNVDQGNSVDENGDLDEEEHQLSDDSQDDGPTQAIPTFFTLPQDWYFSVAGLYFENLHVSTKAFAPLSRYSSPIYILNRVLRI